MRSPCNVTATLLCLRPELVGINGVWPAEGTNTAAQHVQVPSTEQSTIGGIFIRCIVAIFKTQTWIHKLVQKPTDMKCCVGCAKP